MPGSECKWGEKESVALLRSATLKRLLFVMSFSPEYRKINGNEGFEAVDIHDMAASFDLAPKQEPARIHSVKSEENMQDDNPEEITHSS